MDTVDIEARLQAIDDRKSQLQDILEANLAKVEAMGDVEIEIPVKDGDLAICIAVAHLVNNLVGLPDEYLEVFGNLGNLGAENLLRNAGIDVPE